MKKLSINWLCLRYAIREASWAMVDVVIQVIFGIRDWFQEKRRRPTTRKQIELDEYERMLM